MQKTYFHNYKKIHENKKKLNQTSKLHTEETVDINILLNRVKADEKNEMKRKIFFFSFVTIVLGLFGTFITIIR